MRIGVDIEDISRFSDKTPEKDAAFLNRIFTQKELEYCFGYKNPAPHLAARYCAKEAVVKAVSELYDKTVSYNKIEILNNNKGAPFINIYIEDLKKYKFSVSLSHEKDKAAAFIIVE